MTTEMTKNNTITTVGHSIPMDLIFEILLKLPNKSVLRFKSVSKSWISIIRSQQFIEAFMSVSLTRSRILMFFSSPSHQNSYFLSLSSMLAPQKYSLTMPKFKPYTGQICNSVRGFLCCFINGGHVICNPTTGQIIPLAEKNNDYDNYGCCMFLGYDPKSDKYKVLRLMSPKCYGLLTEHSVLTLGGQGCSQTWRTIKTNIPNHCCQNGVCIDGVVYYEYSSYRKTRFSSFDVGSEQVRPIKTPEDLVDISGRLTNYLGKLAVQRPVRNGFVLWVLDDVKNQVWLKQTFDIPSDIYKKLSSFWSFGGITASGEIVFVMMSDDRVSELFWYNVEKKMGRRVRCEDLSEIKGFYPLLFCSYVDNILYL